MKKRITAVILAAVLAVTTLTGCSSSMSGKDAAVTVNGIDVTADIAEFYARYTRRDMRLTMRHIWEMICGDPVLKRAIIMKMQSKNR